MLGDVTTGLMEHAIGTKAEQHRFDMDMTSAYDTVQWPHLDIAILYDTSAYPTSLGGKPRAPRGLRLTP